ncbi:MAG: hypothetical protein V1925_05210 [Candidatus Omnitrophota bacterium]
MKTKKGIPNKGQTVMEYVIIFSVILAAIFSTGIIDRVRDTFKLYLSKATSQIATDR